MSAWPADVRQAARDLTSLGLTRLRQDGRLNVRQRELVRRALARVGEARGWAGRAATSPHPVAEIRRDVEAVIGYGSEALEVELTATVRAKGSEIPELESAAASARALAEADDPGFPAEIRYVHTARDPTLGLITHVEVRAVADAQEAGTVAGAIEKGLPRWDKLRAKMLEDVEEEQRLLEDLGRGLPDFVDSLEDLVRDVLVILG